LETEITTILDSGAEISETSELSDDDLVARGLQMLSLPVAEGIFNKWLES
jgi:hypothetical protein